MRKNWLFVAVLASAALGASGCRVNCKKAENELVMPTNEVVKYLKGDPTGLQLKEYGCPMILSQFQSVSRGTERVRRLAENRWTHSHSYCLQWRHSTRYRCYGYGYVPYYPPYNDCRWESYDYCMQWQTDVTHDPGYNTAVELSANLDAMYDKTQVMCAQAASGNFDAAYQQSRDLLQFITTEVKPEGDTVYSMACGR